MIKTSRKYFLELDEYDYHQLLAVLAYTAKLVGYEADAVQHESLKDSAKAIYNKVVIDE